MCTERQLAKAAEMIEWKKNWHPRGEGSGPIRRGLGLGINSWDGAGHASKANVKIHPDGSVDIEIGTQDLGVGTRTILAMVAAETMGLPIEPDQREAWRQLVIRARALPAVRRRSAAFARPLGKRA